MERNMAYPVVLIVEFITIIVQKQHSSAFIRVINIIFIPFINRSFLIDTICLKAKVTR